MVKEYKEYSKDCPAIDGIEKGVKPSTEEMHKRMTTDPYNLEPFKHYEGSVRSDVEKILDMDDKEFAPWVKERKDALVKLLEPLRLVSTIPNLKFGADYQALMLGDAKEVKSLVKKYENGLEHLAAIERVKSER